YDWGADAERDSGVTIADGRWHHVVETFHNGMANGTKLYVDGTLALSTTITVGNETHDALISSGSSETPTQFFPGSLDEVAYYGTALSAARVQAHYDAAATAGYSAVVA